ncbi:MAG: asparagine--tRNA ligase [Planctomycetes bacterium]|nr:asparagine--tRNA ligase [Planctomycetota bacterium]
MLKKDQTYISELKHHVGKEVTVKGWLYNSRSSGKIHFLQVRDGTGIVQAVGVKNELPEPIFELAGKLTQESSIIVKGIVREDKRASSGFELTLTDVKLLQLVADYPISHQSTHGPAFLMDNRHLWLRSKKQHATLRVRAEIVKAIRDYFDSNGYVLMDAPILTPAACEGTTNLFEVGYFDEKAYLSQSGQLYGEVGAMAFGKVYVFGPTFRAEKSKTRKHLTEFWMVEPEIAYADLDDVMNVAEEFITFIVHRVLENRKEELKTLERNTAPLEKINAPFPRISYDEAVELIKKAGLPFEYGNDFGAPDEEAISKNFDKPVMVHRYPLAIKAFYMKQDPEHLDKALCVDVLAPEGIGEIIGGGQRADDLEYLEKKIAEHGLPRKAFEWYLDLRKYGTVPHGGFGLGVERAVSWICGSEHVRETIPFARMLNRLYP